MKAKEYESLADLINGYVSSVRNIILSAFLGLSRECFLNDEGEMSNREELVSELSAD